MNVVSPTVNRRTLALYALLTCAVIAIALKVWLPAYRQMSQARAMLEQKRQYLAGSQDLQKALEAEYTELDRTQTYLRTWREAVKRSADLARFFAQVHASARATSVNLTSFGPEPTVVYERVGRTQLQLGCTGTFHQIAAFVYALERDGGLIWVDRLQIEQSGESAKPLRCQLKLAIFAVYSDETDEVSAASAGDAPGSANWQGICPPQVECPRPAARLDCTSREAPATIGLALAEP